MIKHSDILQLCRLCLVEEKVNHSIFEETGDLRGILLKITSCLPVSISQDDSLPKRICETCFTKLDSYYKFWNDSANAEKQLLQWLSQTTLGTISKTGQGDINKSRMDKAEIKEETIDLEDGKLDSLEMSTDAKTYILQQQQLPYSVATPKILPSETNETDEPASKRPRRASAMKALEHMESEDEDDDLDDGADAYAKGDTDDSDKEDENYQEGPSTSMDDQPGPSGVGKGTTEASCHEYYNEIEIKEEFDVDEIKNEEFDAEEIENKEFNADEIENEEFDADEIEIKEELNAYEIEIKEELNAYEIEIKEEFNADDIKIEGDTDEEEEILITFELDSDEDLRPINGFKENHKSDIPGLCHICGKTLKRLKAHLRRHGRFKCKTCFHVFKNSIILKNHMKYHKKTPYQCDKCSLYFGTALELGRHSRKHYEKYKCHLCTFMTLNLRLLAVHFGSHNIQQNFLCGTCGHCFISQSTLDIHTQTHTGIRKYTCEFCPKKFTSNHYKKCHTIAKHSVESTGVEKKFTCEVCSRNFSFEQSLLRHLSTIHEIGQSRKVKCPVCSKLIANKFNLKMHLAVHNGELKHICETCGKRFASTPQLRRHIQQHSKSDDESTTKK